MATALELASEPGMTSACRALGVARATAYRHRHPRGSSEPRPRRRSPLALSDAERAAVLAELHSERFVDASPAAVWATLLDEGTYLASERTMYRILAANREVRERRNQLRHPAYERPELLATAPNQLWSWDITKLRGPAKWSYFYLYVLLDVFSRSVPGWLVASHESAALAERLIADSVAKPGVPAGQLTIHADRGSSMRSKPVALLLADLGVATSHSRPHVSNDNAYSEAQFKTLKYAPDFPGRFGSIGDARAFVGPFLDWSRYAGDPSSGRSIGEGGVTASMGGVRGVHTACGPLRAGARRPGCPSRRPSRCLRSSSRAFRPATPQPARAAERGPDQPTREEGGAASVVLRAMCLTRLDRFRGRRRLPVINLAPAVPPHEKEA